jgi:hypothetical protein
MTETPFAVGDRITLKKKHPCGGAEWQIYRIGSEIRMICMTCEHRMKMSRRDAERRTVSRIEATGDSKYELTADPTVDEAESSTESA